MGNSLYSSGIRQRLNVGEPLLQGRNRQHGNGQESLPADVGAVVDERVNRSAHTVVCGVDAKKDHAGEKGEDKTPKHAQQVSLDKSVFFPREDAGEPQRPESEKVVGKHLRNADDIRIRHKLQNTVGAGCHQAGS